MKKEKRYVIKNTKTKKYFTNHLMYSLTWTKDLFKAILYNEEWIKKYLNSGGELSKNEKFVEVVLTEK